MPSTSQLLTILSPDHNNISCQQSSATNILTAPLALPPNMTPVLTSQYISERIFGPAKACNQVTYITETLLQSSLEVSEYVEMVYRQILDFKIIVLTEDQIGSELERFINIQKPACYFASTHTMYILNTALQTLSFAKNLDFIRHEFKHAATNAALSILSGGKYQTSHFCYYPLNDIQKEYVKACIKAGDKNVFELKKLLILETLDKLDSETKSHLQDLRSALQDEYEQYYLTQDKFSLNRMQLREIQKYQGKPLETGDIINFDRKTLEFSSGNPMAPVYGNVHIDSVTHFPTHSTVIFTFQDPLFAAIYFIESHQKLYSNFSSHDLSERDAHLFGSVPTHFIKLFFRDFYEYTTTLINSNKQQPPIQTPAFLEYTTLEESLDTEARNSIENFDIFLKEFSHDDWLGIVDYFFDKGEFNIVRSGLEKMRQHGINTKGANLLQARVEYQDNNLKAAATFYKRAEKQGAILNNEDRLHYSEALYYVGLPKSAKKQQNKAKQSQQNLHQFWLEDYNCISEQEQEPEAALALAETQHHTL